MKHPEVPEILIEQYVLGELPPDKAREVEKSAGFAERVAAIGRSNEEILRAYPADRFATRIKNQYEADVTRKRAAAGALGAPRRSHVVRWLAAGIPATALLVVGAVLGIQSFFGGGAGMNSAVDDAVRIKGSAPQLYIYRSVDGPDTRDAEAEQLGEGAVAHQGDRLQLAYNAGDRPYGAIISVDGRGAVYTHFPTELSAEPRLVMGRTQRLAFGYQLDDAPRFEHFYFITSREPFSVQQLIQTIRAQATRITEDADSLELPSKFEVTSVTILKGE